MKTQLSTPIRRVFGIAFAVLGVAVALIPLNPEVMFAIWGIMPPSAPLFHLMIGGAMLWAAYRACFRQSPLAVPHNIETQSFSPIRRAFAIVFAVLGVTVALIPLNPGVMSAIWGKMLPNALLFHLVIGGAMLRTAYLGYFRWSPLAVQHIVGTLFFFLTVALANLLDGGGLYIFPFLYVAYRLTASAISKVEFRSL